MLHAFFVLLVAAVCGLLVQPVQAEPVDSLSVKADKEDVEPLPTFGEFLRYVGNDRVVTRIPKKVGMGALTTTALVFVSLAGGELEGSDGLAVAGAVYVSLFFGYPIGVYLADMEESSFWMTFVGNGVG